MCLINEIPESIEQCYKTQCHKCALFDYLYDEPPSYAACRNVLRDILKHYNRIGENE